MEEDKIFFYKGNVEKKVSEQFIQSELAQYLQIVHLNFLIGAGCSSYREYGK